MPNTITFKNSKKSSYGIKKNKSNKKNKDNNDFEGKSVFTSYSYFISIIAIGVELFLGFRYYSSTVDYEHTFGMLTLIEGLFAFIGVIITDKIFDPKIPINPFKKKFRKLKFRTLVLTVVMISGLILIQILTQLLVPITIRNIELAFSIVFAGPSEELFFRGTIIGIFIFLRNLIEKSNFAKKIGFSLIFIEFLGVLLSSVFFALMHQNYYNQPAVLLATFLSGMFLGFMFWYFRDITANIMAHFFFNFYAVFRSGLLLVNV